MYKILLGMLAKSLKLSVNELFPNKVTVNRSVNNNEFLQRNFSEIKFKLSIRHHAEKNFGIFSNGCI